MLSTNLLLIWYARHANSSAESESYHARGLYHAAGVWCQSEMRVRRVVLPGWHTPELSTVKPPMLPVRPRSASVTAAHGGFVRRAHRHARIPCPEPQPQTLVQAVAGCVMSTGSPRARCLGKGVETLLSPRTRERHALWRHAVVLGCLRPSAA